METNDLYLLKETPNKYRLTHSHIFYFHIFLKIKQKSLKLIKKQTNISCNSL